MKLQRWPGDPAPVVRCKEVLKLVKSTLLLELIELLKRKNGATIGDLAGALNRSERTVYRWMREISSELYQEVRCENGVYSICGETSPSAVSLTPEELLALRLALKSTPISVGNPLAKHAASAWSKIRDANSTSSVQAATELCDTFGMMPRALDIPVREEISEALHKAVLGREQVEVIYRSQKSNRTKSYVVNPYAVVFRRHAWYVVAYSANHNEIITLRLVRFRSVTPTGVTFDVPEDFSVDDYYEHSWEAWAGGEKVDVKVRFGPRVAQMIAETRRHPTQKVKHETDGSVVLSVTVSGIEEIASWIMGYGKEAEVIEPESLREYILDHARGMVAEYHCAEKSARKVYDPSDNI